MSIKSDLDLAKRYEWYSACADAQGDKILANRYDSLAKMSIIDALNSYSNNISNTKAIKVDNNTYIHNNEFTSEEMKSPSFIITLCISVLLFIIICLI